MRLVNNIFAYIWEGQDNNCNSYVLARAINDQKHVIIDPGHIKTSGTQENAIQILLTKMGQDGINPKDIGLVILTHAHPDHVESAMALRAQLAAKVALHKADLPAYQQMRGVVDIFLEEGEINFISSQRNSLEVFHTPGHTVGHISLYSSQSKALFAGDLIFYRSIGRSDLPGGDPEALKESVLKVSKLDIEYVLSGHPYGHPGVLEGHEEVRENFDFIKERVLT